MSLMDTIDDYRDEYNRLKEMEAKFIGNDVLLRNSEFNIAKEVERLLRKKDNLDEDPFSALRMG